MQDMPLAQDADFVVEWQLTEDAAHPEGVRLIDLAGEGRPSEIILPEEVRLRTTSGH